LSILLHNITKDQYLRDPCGTSSTAFWKNIFVKKPDWFTDIVHEKNLSASQQDGFRIIRYFRLLHDLNEIVPRSLPDDHYFQTANIATQLGTVAHFINSCYEDMHITPEQVEKWTKYKVFDNNLWVFIYDTSSSYPVALGIADFDDAIKEGCLEWIQTLPEKRGTGLGQALVAELLLRLAPKADFATVSGETDNKTKPEALYRKCGFKGEDIWCVLAPK